MIIPFIVGDIQTEYCNVCMPPTIISLGTKLTPISPEPLPPKRPKNLTLSQLLDEPQLNLVARDATGKVCH